MYYMAKKKIIVLVAVLAVISILITVILLVVLLPKNNGVKIRTLEVTLNGEVIEDCEVEIYDQDVRFGVRVNGKDNLEAEENIQIMWKIENNSSDSTINEQGLFYTGNMLGKQTLTAFVKGSNVMEKSVSVDIVPQSGTKVESLAVSVKNGATEYTEGQTIDRDSLLVWGDFGKYSARLTDFDINPDKPDPTDTEVIVKCGGASTSFPISVKRKKLQSIEILNKPYTTFYIEGQVFDKQGLVIQANFEYISEIVEDYEVDDERALTYDDSSVRISYSYNGVTKTVEQNIEVSHRVLVSIAVDDSDVQKKYTQGDIFNPDGLIVLANFESLGTVIVEDYRINAVPLLSTDTNISVSYTENGVTKSATVEGLTVCKPYSNIRRVSIRDPENISLNWYYSYMNDNGEFLNDNTAYQANGLLYDVVGGNYEIPVGAIISVRSLNPSVIDFEIDGINQNVSYPDCFMSWKLTDGELLKIASTQMSGDRISLRFTSEDKEQNFLYGGTWDSPLKHDDFKKLSIIFRDTDLYYYTYTIGNREYTLTQLENVSFNKSTVIRVSEKERTDCTLDLTILYYDDFEIEYFVATEDLHLEKLPVKTRAGYTFSHWSLEENGVQLNDEAFLQYLQSEQEKYVLYACWERENVSYSGGIIGTWSLSRENEGNSVLCRIIFAEDGTFEYDVYINGVVNNAYSGFYNLNGDDITVIDVNTKTDKLLVSVSDFGFELIDGKLNAGIFILQDYSLIKGTAVLTKI